MLANQIQGIDKFNRYEKEQKGTSRKHLNNFYNQWWAKP